MIREKPQNKPIKISIDPNRVLDHKRVILINLNNAFSNDHLELYLEYLSDEIASIFNLEMQFKQEKMDREADIDRIKKSDS